MSAEKSKKALRVAMLGHKRIPSREGGIEIVVAQLATRMVQHGHKVTCYNRRGHHVSGADFDTAFQKEYQGVQIKQVVTIQKKGLAAMSSSFFAAVRAAFGRYDVVHFHAEGPCAMLWLPKLLGKKCIATIHGLDHQRAKWGKFASFYILFGEKCAAKFADEIIVLSENVQQYFLNTYGRKTVLIPNGVQRPVFAPAKLIKEAYDIRPNQYILFLGRLVPEKGVAYLIDAFKQVETEKLLVIAGGSSDTAAFEDALKARAIDDERIVFTGFLQGQALEEFYSNAYLYVLPSDLEGMPLSLLEAMSYGNCCLTSDIPECVSVTGEFGLSFPKGNVEALRDELQRLCDRPQEVLLYRQQAADYICRRYNWDEVTKETLKLYGADLQQPAAALVEEANVESLVGQ